MHRLPYLLLLCLWACGTDTDPIEETDPVTTQGLQCRTHAGRSVADLYLIRGEEQLQLGQLRSCIPWDNPQLPQMTNGEIKSAVKGEDMLGDIWYITTDSADITSVYRVYYWEGEQTPNIERMARLGAGITEVELPINARPIPGRYHALNSDLSSSLRLDSTGRMLIFQGPTGPANRIRLNSTDGRFRSGQHYGRLVRQPDQSYEMRLYGPQWIGAQVLSQEPED